MALTIYALILLLNKKLTDSSLSYYSYQPCVIIFIIIAIFINSSSSPILLLSLNVCRMPLNKWQIEPSRLLESSASTQRASELTDFINLMMTSVIRQLNCVSRYADDMFSELAAEANVIMSRSNQLSQRVSLLKQYATQLSPADEEQGFVILFSVSSYSC